MHTRDTPEASRGLLLQLLLLFKMLFIALVGKSESVESCVVVNARMMKRRSVFAKYFSRKYDTFYSVLRSSFW